MFAGALQAGAGRQPVARRWPRSPLLLACLALQLSGAAAFGWRLPRSHLQNDRSFLVAVLGQTHGRHGVVVSLYNQSNLQEHVLAPLAGLSNKPVLTLDCTGEALPNFDLSCNETAAAAADQWQRFAQCGLCVARLLAAPAAPTHVVRVRPDVTFLNGVRHEDLPPHGSVSTRLRAAKGWTGVTNDQFSYYWDTAECDTSQACLLCEAAPPCEVLDDQFAIMHAETAGPYFSGPAALKASGQCYTDAWKSFPEKVLSQSLRLSGVHTHLSSVQLRLTRDVREGNDRGRPQPPTIPKACA